MQTSEDFGGWGVQWFAPSAEHFDASGFTEFVFWVRKISGAGTFQVIFHDTNDVDQSVRIHEIIPITTSWTQVRVPLPRYDPVNLASIRHIDFAFYGGMAAEVSVLMILGFGPS
jgi:hypothetical protein